MSAKTEFAKIADELKERYSDLLIIAQGQDEMIQAANKQLDVMMATNDFTYPARKKLKCALCDIFDCSTRNSPDPEECLLSLNNSKPTGDKTQ